MKQTMTGSFDADTSSPPSAPAARPLPDRDLDAVVGGAIGGQDEAKRLLDEYLASLDILSRRTDLSDDAKAMMKSSMTAALSRRIGDAVSLAPAP